MKKLLTSFLVSLFMLPSVIYAQNTFEAGDGSFLLNGKPFVVKAAEVHYPRIPRPYWEHRIQMCKALGMNTICIYIFWNIHEQKEGVFDFTGNNDDRYDIAPDAPCISCLFSVYTVFILRQGMVPVDVVTESCVDGICFLAVHDELGNDHFILAAVVILQRRHRLICNFHSVG